MLAVPVVFVVLQFNPIMGNLILISGVAALVCICRLKSEVHQIRFKKKKTFGSEMGKSLQKTI